jgi:hypothetical protein
MSDGPSATTPSVSRATHLQLVQRAFDRGNYREVRRLVAKMREREPSAADTQAAVDLLHRTQPDPLVKYLLLLSALLLLAVTVFSYRHAVH